MSGPSSYRSILVLGPVAVTTSPGPLDLTHPPGSEPAPPTAAVASSAVNGQQGVALSLLAATDPSPVTVDMLVDELWPEGLVPSTGRTAIRVIITRLRARLADGGPSVVFDGRGYRLALPRTHRDHAVFEAAVDLAAAEVARHPDRAAERLVSALRLWRGEPFQPYASPQLALAAAHLQRRRRDAEELLVGALLDAGRPDVAATWATRFVEAEPYREHRWEQLMLALYRSGRQAEALRAAQRATTILRDDLGLDPGPGLRRLEADILAQAPELLGPDRGPEEITVDHLVAALRPSGPPPVPLPPTTLVGRQRELTDLAELTSRSRLVTVLGPPGVGKSRLAAHHAASVTDRRVVWLDVGSLDATTIVAELADRLTVRIGSRRGPEAVADALAHRPSLLVLDNGEHLADVLARLCEVLLATCPSLAILVTSRIPLAAGNETRYVLPPLTNDDAVRLLVDRAGRSAPGPVERAELAELAELLDHLPLSIELVAPALAATGSRTLTDQLAESLEVAASAGPGPRHRSLDEALDWSIELLDTEDRERCEALAVMPRRFTTAELAELTGDHRDRTGAALSRLAAHALVRAEPGDDGQPGWTQLNTVRTRLRSRLAAADRLGRLEQRRAEQYMALVERLGPDLAGPAEDSAVAHLSRARDQLWATHRWLIDQGDAARATRFNLALWEYTFFRQHYAAFGWLDETLALPGVEQVPDHAQLLAEASLAAWARDRFEASAVLADRAEAVAAGTGVPVPLAALKARFNVAVHERRLDEAGALLVQLLAESADRADPRHHADNLVVLALAQAQLGDLQGATQTAEKALALARPTGNPTAISWANVALGSAQLGVAPSGAIPTLSAAARLACTVRNRWVEGMALTALVTALRRAGRRRQAILLLADVTELWGRANSPTQLTRLAQEAVLLLVPDPGGRPAGRLSPPEDRAASAAAQVLGHLDAADHVHPLLADDQEQLDRLVDPLRALDVAVDLAAPGGLLKALRHAATTGLDW